MTDYALKERFLQLITLNFLVELKFWLRLKMCVWKGSDATGFNWFLDSWKTWKVTLMIIVSQKASMRNSMSYMIKSRDDNITHWLLEAKISKEQSEKKSAVSAYT